MRRDPFDMCRTVLHAWDDLPVTKTQPIDGIWFVLRCTRCTSERWDVVDALGRVLRRQYRYAPGYLRKKGEGRLSRDEYRARLLARRLARLRRKAAA